MSKYAAYLFIIVVSSASGFETGIPADTAADSSTGNEIDYHFLNPVKYGSASLTTPLRLILNGGYGITQLDNVDNHIMDFQYQKGIDNIRYNLEHPFEAIEKMGWNDFLLQEVIPFGVDSEKAQYWPNYLNHLIGGGMSYRLMVEWFDHHEYPMPTLWGIGTITIYHLLNEVVENGAYNGPNTDAIADLYIFNPLGMVLFSFEPVCRFFGSTLNMADWSYQVSFNPWNKTIANNGQNFVVKYPLPWWDRWSLFYHWGTHGEFGVSHRRDDGSTFSFGMGLKASDLVDLTEGVRTVKLVGTAGFFYDRNNSLLMSVLFSQSKRDRMRINLYPGLVEIGSWKPGFFMAVDQDYEVTAGLELNVLHLPFGIAMNAEGG